MDVAVPSLQTGGPSDGMAGYPHPHLYWTHLCYTFVHERLQVCGVYVVCMWCVCDAAQKCHKESGGTENVNANTLW